MSETIKGQDDFGETDAATTFGSHRTALLGYHQSKHGVLQK